MPRTSIWLSLASLALALSTTGCGSSDSACSPAAQTGCDDGQVCELVTGGDPACFAPLIVQGRVFDLGDQAGIVGARVVALDVNNSAVSSVAVSVTDGAYTLAIPSERDANGVPVARSVTLRADAAGYLTFPSGIRPALPVDTGIATMVDGSYVVMSALTDIGLLV